jgi:tight adherence protein C
MDVVRSVCALPVNLRIHTWFVRLQRRYRIPLLKTLDRRLRRIQKGKENEDIVRDLPHMIDTVALCVAAGLSFDQALLSYTEKYDTSLAHHFGQALRYWQTGLKLRSEALDDLVGELDSKEVARFVSALQQSLVLGTALVYVLESQAAEARDAHKQHLETRIAKMPVKMLLPMATCVIPSLLILVLGPVVIEVLHGLGSGL